MVGESRPISAAHWMGVRLCRRDDLAHLHHRLGDVGGEGPPGVARQGGGFAQQFLLHRVDLGGEDDGGEAARGVGLGRVHQVAGGAEAAPAGLRVPAPGHRLRRGHAPLRRGEAGAGPDPQAAVAHHLHPGRERRGEIDQRSDAGSHELGIGQAHGRLAAGIVEPVGLAALEQPGHLLLGHAMVLAHAAHARLSGGMGMDVDQAGHDQHAGGVDQFTLERAGRMRRNGGDAAILDQDIAAMRIGVGGAVPQDGPGGVSNEGAHERSSPSGAPRRKAQRIGTWLGRRRPGRARYST